MVDVRELARRATELHRKGLNTVEIGDELHLSPDTVDYLIEEGSEGMLPPSDVKIGWRSVGISPKRIRLVSEIMADIVSEELTKSSLSADAIAGIAINGVLFAYTVADILGKELIVYRPPSERGNSVGAFSSNYAGIKGKNIAVIDDVLSTGHAMESAIRDISEAGGRAVVAAVMVNKSSLNEIGGVPLRGMVRARSIGGTILGGGPLKSFAYK
ncbi:MAG: orotate phosphoribosyltransferase-like protein [Thermoplasmata archaeon]|uniref:Orotate phosphoribosyltransferase-like protein n=1 Tax=Candidatus Sysuiplasma superficiale TaxID=2823368 RepID=A0A8J7YHV7_9ARCH|nr:orotate phosphoribosyltransferase-like protein [Candidatus Sysuiplasma superficiale]MBX8644137.1 orotate phosphoribosyltransferase-like protein [Candidatus Sysuiplasma superficiale]MCL4346306.1 orotate phosphoribosyltransferase-like protein [Candidatus Thermoplasmatota archaeon]MCL5437108.1 orotate phosphoribosyltransferase-like protein [Candidatus Thermoplasmatota archaeon]